MSIWDVGFWIWDRLNPKIPIPKSEIEMAERVGFEPTVPF